MCQQFMQVRDVEPATIKVGTDFTLKRRIEDRIERVERIWRVERRRSRP
jgi:hypothetical protein